MTPRFLVGFALVGLAVAVPQAAEQPRSTKPRIEGLEFRREGSALAVSFMLADGMTQEALDRIQSGIPVHYRHRVEVLARRAVPLWPSKVISGLHIDTGVKYDSLNRRYDLSREIRFRPRKKGDSPVEQLRHSTHSIEEVRAWMTRFADLPLLDASSVARPKLRVKVESILGRRYVWYLFPARHIVSAERKLEP